MIEVGLTGGIGSGKSTVSKIFNMLGVPVFNADVEAKKLYYDVEVLKKVRDAFGEVVLQEDFTNIDKRALANVVFNDKDALQRLNGIIHPILGEVFLKWTEQFKDAKYIIQEAAILFESGFYKKFDKVVTISADEQLRIERVVSRDSVTKSEVLSRVSNQWNDFQREEKADFTICNNRNQLLIPQVLDIHYQLLKL